MDHAVARTGRRRGLLALYLVITLMVAEDCGCELPDPSGEDGWRLGSPAASTSQR